MLLEVLETARKILRRDDHGQPSPSASTGTVMRTRAPAVYHFSKDLRTGRRKTHCQYRPRSSAAASKNVTTVTHTQDCVAIVTNWSTKCSHFMIVMGQLVAFSNQSHQQCLWTLMANGF